VHSRDLRWWEDQSDGLLEVVASAIVVTGLEVITGLLPVVTDLRVVSLEVLDGHDESLVDVHGLNVDDVSVGARDLSGQLGAGSGSSEEGWKSLEDILGALSDGGLGSLVADSHGSIDSSLGSWVQDEAGLEI